MTIIYKEYPKTSIVELNFGGKVTKQDINDVTPRIESFIAAHAHCFTLFLTEIISLIHLKFRNILTNNKEILYDKEIKFIS